MAASAGEQSFLFDQDLAVDLATAYVKSHFKSRRDHAIPDIDFNNPMVTSIVAKGPRRLVSVSFVAKTSQAGAYVVMEQCASIGLLVAVDEATTDNIAAYRSQLQRATITTNFAIPTICPSQ